MYYTSYLHAISHALFSGMASLFCMIYADGVKDTTWFHCNFYKLHMFDIQLYLQTVSMGYLLQDLIFCLIATEKWDGLAY
jgi:hypothetical protein